MFNQEKRVETTGKRVETTGKRVEATVKQGEITGEWVEPCRNDW